MYCRNSVISMLKRSRCVRWWNIPPFFGREKWNRKKQRVVTCIFNDVCTYHCGLWGTKFSMIWYSNFPFKYRLIYFLQKAACCNLHIQRRSTREFSMIWYSNFPFKYRFRSFERVRLGVRVNKFITTFFPKSKKNIE